MALTLLLVFLLFSFRATDVLAFRMKAYLAFIFANSERAKFNMPALICKFPSIWRMIFSFRRLSYKDYFSQEILDEVQL